MEKLLHSCESVSGNCIVTNYDTSCLHQIWCVHYLWINELTGAQRKSTAAILEAFEQYCIGDMNKVYGRYLFHIQKQSASESFYVFAADLCSLVHSCGFGTAESSMIYDHNIVHEIHDDMNEENFLGCKGLTFRRPLTCAVRRKQLRANSKQSQRLELSTLCVSTLHLAVIRTIIVDSTMEVEPGIVVTRPGTRGILVNTRTVPRKVEILVGSVG